MAILPNDPLIWFDFSQGNCNPVSLTVPNLGTMGGVLNCSSGVTFNGSINSGVVVFNNTSTSSGYNAYMDIYQQSLNAQLHRDCTWVITYCLPSVVPSSFSSAFSMGPSFDYNASFVPNTSQIRFNNQAFNNALTAKRFYTFMRTSSSNDFYNSCKAYDHYSQSYLLNYANTAPLSLIDQNFKGTPDSSINGMLRFAGYFTSATTANLNCMIGDFAYWPYGMSDAQMEDVMSYHKHRYSQNPILP